jgi:hypothetical protein
VQNHDEKTSSSDRSWINGRRWSEFLRSLGFNVPYIPKPRGTDAAVASSEAEIQEINHGQQSVSNDQQLQNLPERHFYNGRKWSMFFRALGFDVVYMPKSLRVRQAIAQPLRHVQNSISFQQPSQDADIVSSSVVAEFHPNQQQSENDGQIINLPQVFQDMDIPAAISLVYQRLIDYIIDLRRVDTDESHEEARNLMLEFMERMVSFGAFIRESEGPVPNLENENIFAQLRQLREYGEQQIANIQTDIVGINQWRADSHRRINDLETSLAQTREHIETLIASNQSISSKNEQLERRVIELEHHNAERPQPQVAQVPGTLEAVQQARATDANIEELVRKIEVLEDIVAGLQRQTTQEFPTYEKDFDKNHKVLFRPKQDGILVSIFKTSNGAVLGAKEVNDFLSYHAQRSPEFLSELFESRELAAPGFLAQHGLFAQEEQITQWHAPGVMAV